MNNANSVMLIFFFQKIPLVDFLRLMYRHATRLVLVLGGTQCIDNLQVPLMKVFADRLEMMTAHYDLCAYYRRCWDLISVAPAQNQYL